MDYINLDNLTDTTTTAEGETDETNFMGQGINVYEELLQSTVNDYYNTLKESKKYVTPIGPDFSSLH